MADKCDFHLPHLHLPPGNPDLAIRYTEENFQYMQKFFPFFYRNCSGDSLQIPFSRPGSLQESISTPWESNRTRTLDHAVFKLNTVGTTDSEVKLYKNSVLIHTQPIPAGSARETSGAINVEFVGETDTLTAEISTIGTSAAGLSIICYFA